MSLIFLTLLLDKIETFKIFSLKNQFCFSRHFPRFARQGEKHQTLAREQAGGTATRRPAPGSRAAPGARAVRSAVGRIEVAYMQKKRKQNRFYSQSPVSTAE